MKKNIDPITAEIIRHALEAIAEEMFAIMKRTAMSAIIYEVLDMGTAVCDRNGELAGTGAGIPIFVNIMDKSVRYVIQKFDGDIAPGDIFVTNDPYHGGVTHLNDVAILLPVFVDGEIVAWTGNIAHWNDLSGSVPGGMSTDAQEIFQEGLRLSAVKLFSSGKLIDSVYEILKSNTRMPEHMNGDLWAGIAAVRAGERGILELVGKYGKNEFLNAIAVAMDYGEQVVREALQQFPETSIQFSEPQDNGLTYNVKINIRRDTFIVDLSDNPEQDKGPWNISRDVAIIAAQMIMKSLLAPAGICNGGSFRVLRVLTRKGTIFDPVFPAAVGIYYETSIRLYDLIWRALAERFPERLPSGHFASVCATLLGGVHPDTGRQYCIVEPEPGGWGGSTHYDGNSAQFSGLHGETYYCPAEIAEARNGIQVDRISLHQEDGGEGQHRGGKGVCIEYRIRSWSSWLTVAYTRSKVLPWGLCGGRDGSPNYAEVIRVSGEKERYTVVTGLALKKDDVVRVVTGTGAGWGEPSQRDPDLIRNDLKNGYITPAQAEKYYGFKEDDEC